MLIMFFAGKIDDDMTSYRVHIFEVLNGLLKSGNGVIYAGGQPYAMRSSANGSPPATRQRKTILDSVKAGALSRPFKYEMLFLWRLTYETRLFCAAFMTLLRNRPDVIYWRNDMSFGGAVLAALFRLPSVVEVNGITVDEINLNNDMDRLSRHLFKMAERASLRRSARYIVVTPELKEVLHRDYRIRENRITLIRNGANTELFTPVDTASAKRQIGLQPDDHYICFVGELQQWAGVHTLIASLPRIISVHHNAKILIVGEGPALEELRRQTKDLAITEKVIFAGRVPHERVPLYISASDICTNPAIGARHDKIGGSGLKMCEYLSCSKPVIASRIGGSEILEDFNCGCMVTPDDPEDLASAAIKLIGDPALRRTMGQNGRKYVLENRSWESVATRVAEVCQEAIRQRKPSI